jgi:Methyltransferase domain
MAVGSSRGSSGGAARRVRQPNALRQYFEQNPGRLIHKWMHYFDIYDRHLGRFRGDRVTVVEIGVWHGGSLQMWKSYFGPHARIIGVDVDPRCKQFEEKQVEIHIGDQEDRQFLREFVERVGEPDVVIDDGGHTMSQQMTTFEELYPRTATEGVYVVEDLHTSYWSEFGGGFRGRSTFVEYTKDLVDSLNAGHSRDHDSLVVDDFTRTTRSMHFYDSVVVFEKGVVEPPYHRQTGRTSFE